MNFKEFIKNEGLKKLALTKLKSASYSILIYLFNEILSGVDEIIASRKELSILLGWPEKQICDGLDELQFCNMIHIIEVPGKPIRIRAQLNLEIWNNLQSPNNDTNKKNLLGDAKNLHSILPSENNNGKGMKLTELNIFDTPIPFPKSVQKNKSDHKNKFEKTSPEEFTLNDLEAFREKHNHIDTKIKELALQELNAVRLEKRNITADEELLLQILSQHHEPKKQLMLALRSNLIYPNLKTFLSTTKLLADIPSTTHKK